MLSITRAKATSLILGVMLAIGATLCPVTARAAGSEEVAGYSDSDPAPTGSLCVRRPTLAWRIAPHSGERITGVRMQINGVSVTAVYDPLREAVVYTPATSLQPGVYTVRCRVTIDRKFDIDRDWSFTVASDATETLAAPTVDQAGVCAAINSVRAAMNLPALILDSRLCAAAAGHSAYLVQNHAMSHTQAAKMPGFTAATAQERAGAFGFGGECYEAISAGSAGPSAIAKLFDAPYHRAPFLQPGAFEVGSGSQADIVTLLFGMSRQSDVVTYPYNGQKNVPIGWDGIESPNPLRLHRPDGVGPSAAPTGYPITLFSFGADSDRINITGATLTDSNGRDVPVFVNTPDNDDFLQNGVLLIPQSPLKPGAVYRVAVLATDTAGHSVSRSWSFSTAPLGRSIVPGREGECGSVAPLRSFVSLPPMLAGDGVLT